MGSPSRSCVIVGGGVFGASTAYHLIKKYPNAIIDLVDRMSYPSQLAASWDWNKVIRADYSDIVYTEKALEALDEWRTNPLFKPFYHESGCVRIDGSELGKKAIANYEKLRADVDATIVGQHEIKTLYGGVFADADYTDVGNILHNKSCGWAEASAAVKAVIEEAIAAGVRYVQGTVSTLLFDDCGSCTGVQLVDGKTLHADQVILSTGAATAQLLADSAPQRDDLQVGDRIVAAAVVTGVVKLRADQEERFANAPVFIHDMKGVEGQTMPPTADNLLKLCRDASFKNTIRHGSGRWITAPPDERDHAQWSPPQRLKDELELVCKGIYGSQLDGQDVEEYRICWDGITSNQDFIVTLHPHCKDLFVATAGSFHGWKFFPIIGKYVLDLLDGVLDPALAKKWAWDRDSDGAAHSTLIPKRELRDIDDQGRGMLVGQ